MKNFFACIAATFAVTISMAQTSVVTFNLNMENETVSSGGVYLGGGVIGGHNEYQLTDDDGDGTFSVTVELENSASGGNYIFLNGNCSDWSCKEQLGGQPCADPENWNDRILPELTSDLELSTCFGVCSNDGSCELTIETADITFRVNTETIEVGPNGMYLGGGDYFGDAMGHAMSDDDGDGMYEVVVAVPVGYSGNYVFLNSPNDGQDWGAKEDLAGLPCADGTWNDRLLPTVEGNVTYSTCFAQCSEDGSCQAPPLASVITFRVDMSDYTDDYGVVNLNGSFNGWCGGCTAMTDEDSDGIYEIAVELDNETTYEYKFTLDGWTNQEQFIEGDACTSTIDGFTNRSLTTGAEATVLDVVCYNSCVACEGSNGGGGGNDSLYSVTFNLNMELEEVDPTGVYLAGGGNFGNPGDNQMTDDDGDGTYSITIEVEAGFSSYYTFTNGACGDWSCKENIAGLPCANPDNFNDRFLPEVTGNTVVSTCFGQCSEDGSCEMIAAVPVTFKVDMSEQLVVSGVTIFGGSINGWNNTATPLADDDGDGIYEATIDLLPGGHEYKFVNSGVEEVFDPIIHGECTVTTPDSVFTNRYLFIDDETSVETIAYCFNSCDVCTPDNVTEFGVMDFKLVPSVTSDIVELRTQGANNAPYEVSIISFTGALVKRVLLPANTPVWTFDMSSEAAGVYFVQMNLRGAIATEKLIKVQ